MGLMERRGREVNGDEKKTDVEKLLGRGHEGKDVSRALGISRKRGEK